MQIIWQIFIFLQLFHLNRGSCQGNCKTCSVDDAKTCSSCIISNTRKNEPNKGCPCSYGYIETYETQCSECHQQCQECQGNVDYCTVCDEKNFRQWDSNKCPCLIGYFEFDGFAVCQKCGYQCRACNEINLCTQCDESWYRLDLSKTDQDCPCMDGFFDQLKSTCLQCSPECRTCSKNEKHCILCAESNYEYDESQQECICDENRSYYENNECKRCEPQCFNCWDSKTCRSCSSAYRDLPSCYCLSGYFELSSIKDCQKCHRNCKECFSDTLFGCKSCLEVNGKYFDAVLHTCLCSTNTVMNSFYQCDPCQPQCSKCSSPESVLCTTCFRHYIEIPEEQNEVQCRINCPFTQTLFYEDERLKCQQCKSNCSNCIQESCVGCLNTYLDLKQIGQCNEQCIEGYFFSADNTQKKCSTIQFCKKCDCFGCVQCQKGYIMSQNQQFCFLTDDYVPRSQCIQICEDCCFMSLYEFDEQCYTQCPTSTVQPLGLQYCMADIKLKQLEEEIQASSNHVYTIQIYQGRKDSDVVLILIRIIVFIASFVQPIHILMIVQNKLIFLSLINGLIPHQTESLFKQIYFYSLFNPDLLGFNFFTMGGQNCKQTTTCLGHLNVKGRGYFDSTSLIDNVGSVLSQMLLTILLKFVIQITLYLKHRTKYRDFNRYILVNLFYDTEQRQKNGLVILILEKVNRSLTSYICGILAPPLIIGSALDILCYNKQVQTSSSSSIVSLFCGLYVLGALFNETYTLNNILAKNVQQYFQDKKRANILPHRQDAYSLSQEQQKKNIVEISRFVHYLIIRFANVRSQILFFYFGGLLIFALYYSQTYQLFILLAMQIYTCIYGIYEYGIVYGKLPFTGQVIDTCIDLISIIITCLLISSSLKSDPMKLDDTLYWMVIIILLVTALRSLITFVDDIMNYRSYLVIQVSDDQEVVRRPYKGELKKNQQQSDQKVLKKEDDDVQIDDKDNPNFSGELVYPDGTSVIVHKKQIKQQEQKVEKVNSKQFNIFSLSQDQSKNKQVRSVKFIKQADDIPIREEKKIENSDQLINQKKRDELEDPIIKSQQGMFNRVTQAVIKKQEKILLQTLKDKQFDSWASADEEEKQMKF